MPLSKAPSEFPSMWGGTVTSEAHRRLDTAPGVVGSHVSQRRLRRPHKPQEHRCLTPQQRTTTQP